MRCGVRWWWLWHCSCKPATACLLPGGCRPASRSRRVAYAVEPALF
uniref:Uncharacterized protein n=1 Tax=Setaria viridis TaxID=4556 RepID=A0A4U6WIH5_SETVI|nr:hypothetical protein SEVIR_1G353250v2 [Setaria viridis]